MEILDRKNTFKDRGEYLGQESIAREETEEKGLAKYEKEWDEYPSQLRALLSLLGYRYEDNSAEAAFYDLADSANENEMPHVTIKSPIIKIRNRYINLTTKNWNC